MSMKLRSRSTDLNVLRSLLLNDEDSDRSPNSQNNENLDFLNNDGLQNPENDSTKTMVTSMSKKIHKPKVSETDVGLLERGPFLITRINSRHKPQCLRSEDESTHQSLYTSSPLQSATRPYKSIHFKNIVDKQDLLQERFQHLSDMLDNDILTRTAAVCDQSMNEARQLIQNSLATSRIVSSFINEGRNSSFPGNVPSSIGLPSTDLELSRTKNKLTSTVFLGDSFLDSDISGFVSKEGLNEPLNSTSALDRSFHIKSNDVARSTSSKRATDHRLNSEEPFIQQWLQTKERESRRLRRQEEQEKRIERAVSMNAERVLQQRQAASEDAFRRWCQEKAKTGTRYVEPPKESEPEESDDEPPQAGRQPRPTQNLKRRPMGLVRPKTVASFNIRSDLRMKLRGQKVGLIVPEPSTSIRTSRIQPTLSMNNDKHRPQTAIPRERRVESTKMQTSRRSEDPWFISSYSRSSKNEVRKRKRSKRNSVQQKPTDACDDRENTEPRIGGYEDYDDKNEYRMKEDIRVKQLIGVRKNDELTSYESANEESDNDKSTNEILFIEKSANYESDNGSANEKSGNEISSNDRQSHKVANEKAAYFELTNEILSGLSNKIPSNNVNQSKRVSNESSSNESSLKERSSNENSSNESLSNERLSNERSYNVRPSNERSTNESPFNERPFNERSTNESPSNESPFDELIL